MRLLLSHKIFLWPQVIRCAGKIRPGILAFAVSAAIVLPGLLAPPHSHATTVIPPTFDELVQAAELIIEGRVTQVASRWVGVGDDKKIKTDFTFAVLDTLKGTSPPTYTLQVLGGTVGDVTMEVGGAPHFSVGDRTLLFVTANGTQFVPLVGIMHGHYEIKKDAGINQEIVVNHEGRPLRSVDDVGKDEHAAAAAAAPLAPLTPEKFKELIRQKTKPADR